MDRMKYTFLDQPAVSLFTSSTHGSSVGTVVSETECFLTELGEWQFKPISDAESWPSRCEEGSTRKVKGLRRTGLFQ